MENLKNKKFKALSKEELEQIKGGRWNHWKYIGGDGNGGSIEARYNWWGRHCTRDIRGD